MKVNACSKASKADSRANALIDEVLGVSEMIVFWHLDELSAIR